LRRPPPTPPRDATCRHQRVAVRQPAPSPARLASGLRPPWLRPLIAADGTCESHLRHRSLWRGHPARDSQPGFPTQSRPGMQPGWLRYNGARLSIRQRVGHGHEDGDGHGHGHRSGSGSGESRNLRSSAFDLQALTADRRFYHRYW